MRLPRGMAPAGPPKEAVRRDGPVRFQCGAVRVRLRWRVLLGKRRAHPRGQTDRRHGLVRLRRRLLPGPPASQSPRQGGPPRWPDAPTRSAPQRAPNQAPGQSGPGARSPSPSSPGQGAAPASGSPKRDAPKAEAPDHDAPGNLRPLTAVIAAAISRSRHLILPSWKGRPPSGAMRRHRGPVGAERRTPFSVRSAMREPLPLTAPPYPQRFGGRPVGNCPRRVRGRCLASKR